MIMVKKDFVKDEWKMIGMRLMMGLEIGGIMKCIKRVIRNNVKDSVEGGIMGY